MSGTTRICVSALLFLSFAYVTGSSSAMAGERTSPAADSVSVALDLGALKSSLRQTDAIGLATKLSLKGELKSLIKAVRKYHDGNGSQTPDTLSVRFAALMDRTLGLVKQDDPVLFNKLHSARGALWENLIDADKFTTALKRNRNARMAMNTQR